MPQVFKIGPYSVLYAIWRDRVLLLIIEDMYHFLPDSEGKYMGDSTTDSLAEILADVSSTKEMEAYLQNSKVRDSFRDFVSYFRSLPQVQNMKDSDLILKSGIERSYYYQIMKGTKKNPGRDKILRLCIGAGLTLQQTRRALELSGSAPLYPRNRRDIILSVAINQKVSVVDAGILLDKYKEQPLA